jgi:hypothetical protein
MTKKRNQLNTGNHDRKGSAYFAVSPNNYQISAVHAGELRCVQKI